MTPNACRYCSALLDDYGKQMHKTAQLPSEDMELCFSCGSMVKRATDAARHCACPHCAEQRVRAAIISVIEKNN